MQEKQEEFFEMFWALPDAKEKVENYKSVIEGGEEFI